MIKGPANCRSFFCICFWISWNMSKWIFEPSPWNFGDITSPNGQMQIVIEDAVEMAMGAPLSANAFLVSKEDQSRFLISKNAGGPVIWAPDSTYILLPIWTPSHDQMLVMFDVATKQLKRSTQRFTVLNIKSFDGETIEGTTRPNSVDKPLTLKLSELFS